MKPVIPDWLQASRGTRTNRSRGRSTFQPHKRLEDHFGGQCGKPSPSCVFVSETRLLRRSRWNESRHHHRWPLPPLSVSRVMRLPSVCGSCRPLHESSSCKAVAAVQESTFGRFVNFPLALTVPADANSFVFTNYSESDSSIIRAASIRELLRVVLESRSIEQDAATRPILVFHVV